MRFLILLFTLSRSQLNAIPACLAPAGEWITSEDLAVAAPTLAALPPHLKLSYSPVPGLQRVFRPDELRRLALAHGLPDPHLAANICFAWPLAPLEPAVLRAAMAKELTGRSPQIELIAQSLAPAPEGEVIFPLAGLSAFSENPAVWKGYVRYTETRRFEIWASVRIRVHETHLKAQGAIHAGERLRPGQWRAESYDGPLLRDRILRSDTDLAGLVAQRDFADGALLLALFFEPPKSVEVGDPVTVIAGIGAAHIEAQGVALGAGHCGEVILIRNPRSNRTFRARIASAGVVEVLAGTSAGLVGNEPVGGNPL